MVADVFSIPSLCWFIRFIIDWITVVRVLAHWAVGTVRECGAVLYGYQPLSKAVGAEFSEYRKIIDKVIDTPSSFLAFSFVYFSLLFLARWWHEMTEILPMLLNVFSHFLAPYSPPAFKQLAGYIILSPQGKVWGGIVILCGVCYPKGPF